MPCSARRPLPLRTAQHDSAPGHRNSSLLHCPGKNYEGCAVPPRARVQVTKLAPAVPGVPSGARSLLRWCPDCVETCKRGNFGVRQANPVVLSVAACDQRRTQTNPARASIQEGGAEADSNSQSGQRTPRACLSAGKAYSTDRRTYPGEPRKWLRKKVLLLILNTSCP